MLFSRCAFCDNCVGDWEVGDIPLEEHAKLFPMCGFIRGLSVGNISIQSGRLVYQGTSSREYFFGINQVGLSGDFQQEYSYTIRGFPVGIFLYNQVGLSEDLLGGILDENIPIQSNIRGLPVGNIPIESGQFYQGLSVGNIPIQSGRFIRGLIVKNLFVKIWRFFILLTPNFFIFPNLANKTLQNFSFVQTYNNFWWGGDFIFKRGEEGLLS